MVFNDPETMVHRLNIKYVYYLYLLFLFAGTVLPLNKTSVTLNDNYTMHVRWDYLLHMLVYIPLPVLLGAVNEKKTALQTKSGPARTNKFLRILLISAVIAVFFEALQLVIPYRVFNINDLLANGAGTIIGTPGILIVRRLSSKT